MSPLPFLAMMGWIGQCLPAIVYGRGVQVENSFLLQCMHP